MNIEILSAQQVDQGGVAHWYLGLEIDRGDGKPPERIAHVLPVDTFEWRSAEYGIDPTDFDTLLHTVLYEPHLPKVDDVAPLFTAPTVKHAREGHLARIAGVRGTGKVTGRTGLSPFPAGPEARVLLDSGVEDPIAVLRRHSPMDAEHLAAKRAHISRARAAHGQRRAAISAPEVQLRHPYEAAHAESPDQSPADTSKGSPT